VPAGVQPASATLNALVNPEGVLARECVFEFGPTPAYGQTLDCEPFSAGAGVIPVPVSVGVTGLLPGSEYHYRASASNAAGAEQSPDQRLITAPEVGGESVSNVSQFAAVVHASIEPGEVPTTYSFAYGPTSAYGSAAPIPDVSLPVVRGQNTVSETLTGLQAGTTYHYAVVASSPAGTFTGPDRTFATPSIPVPVVSTQGAGGVTVGQATLSGVVDPQGWDTTYSFQYGTSTAYGSSWPTVPVDLGDLTGGQPVSVIVQNLLPGTTYHYRLVATSSGGTSYGADATFTTGEYAPSVIPAVPVLEIFAPSLPPSTGSPKPKAKPLTRAQLLARALRACSKQPKGRRASCRVRAHERYAPKSEQIISRQGHKTQASQAKTQPYRPSRP
jgi:hypothetical protein